MVVYRLIQENNRFYVLGHRALFTPPFLLRKFIFKWTAKRFFKKCLRAENAKTKVIDEWGNL